MYTIYSFCIQSLADFTCGSIQRYGSICLTVCTITLKELGLWVHVVFIKRQSKTICWLNDCQRACAPVGLCGFFSLLNVSVHRLCCGNHATRVQPCYYHHRQQQPAFGRFINLAVEGLSVYVKRRSLFQP